MIDLVRHEFGTNAEFEKLVARDQTNRYQNAFEYLHSRHGQDVVNKIVRTAVWNALDTNKWPSHIPITTADEADSSTCRELDQCVDAWILPSSVDVLGKLLVDFSDSFGTVVLTTNFDPLIRVSVLRHGGKSYRTVLHDDGKLGQTFAEGTHIVHLHGYWYDFDTLHTPEQLIQPRRQLRRSLEQVVKASTLVVLGYSGWDDVVTRTLVDLISDSGANPEIMWAFHEDDPIRIERCNKELLSILRPGVGRGRVSLYRGVDCRSVLADVHMRLDQRATRASESESILSVEHMTGRSEPDSPLFASPWVGREQELRMLGSSPMPVIFITGIGGQGKSALAGRFLQEQAIGKKGRFELWDWRDCREESDRLTTQLLRLVERLGHGGIDLRRIEHTNLRAIVGVLFRVLKDRRALMVFDNVDQYLDLETLTPVKGLDVLLNEVQTRAHHSCFLFTCRPDVRLDESRALRVPLSGITLKEALELISASGLPEKDHHLAPELHQATDGHPFWLRLIIMQAIRHPNGLHGVLNQMKRGGAKLPDTTRSIWTALSDQQRSLLRTMAELDRPEPESRLIDMLPGPNPNRINRALKALRSFHLIETRTHPDREPLLGLHPIIREFVRTNFPKRDRERYVLPIIRFLDRESDDLEVSFLRSLHMRFSRTGPEQQIFISHSDILKKLQKSSPRSHTP